MQGALTSKDTITMFPDTRANPQHGTRPLTAGEEESLCRYYAAYGTGSERDASPDKTRQRRLLSRLDLSGKRVLELACESLPILTGLASADFILRWRPISRPTASGWP